MHYKPLQLLFILIAVTGGCAICSAATQTSNGGTMPSMPDILDVINKATTPADDAPAEWTAPVKLVIVFTALALIPSLMVMTTSFTRIVIVLSFARRALGTQTILGAWCGPMSPGSAYVLLHHWIGEVDGRAGAWGWVHGGMGALSQCIADSARAAGATLRDSSPVQRVVVEDGRAIGVELEDGTVLHAKQVISNAHPTTTYLDLIGEQNLSDEVVRD